MKYKKIFFVGIKGVGMTSLSIIAKEAGVEVAGSDIEKEFITDETLKENQIQIYTSFTENVLHEFIGTSALNEVLLITTSAHGGFENPQVIAAKNLGIEVLTHGQAVGRFMEGSLFDRSFQGISIAGSHGKTTISGMLSTAMTFLGLDPSYTVGTSKIFPMGNPGHLGSGTYFIAEADEYVSEIQYDRIPKLLYQFPRFLMLNNIDFDHPDFYNSIEEIESVFETFLGQVNKDGVIFVNGDDERIQNLLNKSNYKNIIRSGISEHNDYFLGDYKESGSSISFDVHKGSEKNTYTINIPGVHNTLNVLHIIAFLDFLGYDSGQINEAIGKYTGSKRRFETVGKMKNGALIIDDYAHHPEEITKTLSAVRLSYPDKRILCIFQPHTLSRTEALLEHFAASFAGVEQLILLPVFITQREFDTNADNDVIFSVFKKVNRGAVMLKDNKSVVEYVIEHVSPDFIVLTMGAGDVYLIGRQLINV